MFSIVVGTRPEIVKMAPIIFEFENNKIDYEIVHTGQHYNFNLSELFFKELELPKPHHFLDVGSGSQASQTAKALIGLEEVFLTDKPEMVIVEGDTNSVLAGALAAVKLGLPVGHVESGLRSHDWRMPEEHNRILTDHMSSHLFAPTEHSAKNLGTEGVTGKVYITGNTVIDACLKYLPIAHEQSKVMNNIKFDDFVLVTAHRAENVDDRTVLEDFLKVFLDCPLPIVYPMHPRTMARFKEFGLLDALKDSPNIQILEPVGYLDFLVLMSRCAFLITDSGGIQEEITAPNIMKKAFVLRISTDRPESVESGHVEVLGVEYENAIKRIREYAENPENISKSFPYGKGDAAKRIVDQLVKERLDW
jgi:UDP-N-acetylglucosamine 2-epimerase (non-hydrolysing)